MRDIRIGVDIDGVCADTIGAMQSILGYQYDIDLINALTGWWTDDDYINAKLQMLIEDPKFYYCIPPVVNAAWGVFQLIKNADAVYYVTHRPNDMRALTKDWLERWGFPNVPLLVTPSVSKIETAKSLCLTHFVDDKLSTIRELRAANIQAWLFRCYSYGDRGTLNEVRDWRQLLSLIKIGTFDFG